MRVGRTSIGSRIISMLLVICMVFGMVPLSAFAATTNSTADSVAAIREYAASLLNSNFSIAASEIPSGDDSKKDKFTWDTEGKETNWRYYNGVMLDALLMLGVDSNAGNALEFAKDFMDTNTENSDSKAVTWYLAKEVDSVPPALVLFDLLDTAEVTESDRAIYVKAINYVYKQLEAQTKYSQCGGNFLHKMDNNSWATWNIGLDGIYMALPFLMEYAAALDAQKITNTVNSDSASDIYKEVYDRLMWVADNMYDEDTGLYHHGYSVEGTEVDGEETHVNGHFWGRGIGWYAAGLVMCIDLMPEGTYKTELIKKAVKLFDGMLPYQDDSGLWYNVVNRDDDLDKNELETSGTALMAYAMMKAYNEGWVDAKYATAAEKAFNGIVSQKMNNAHTEISGIYLKSGVGTTDSYYCGEGYKKNEAKGVGGVIMAAAEVDKYLRNAETFTTGVVVAPEMTVAADATTVDTSNIKVSLLGSQGTIKNGVASQMTYVVGEASNGKATVTVKNGDATIGTFQVKVVDPSSPATGKGTLGIETGEVIVPSNPSFSAGDWVNVSTGGDGAGFVLTTTLQAGVPYIFTKGIGSNSVNGAGYSGGKIAGMTVKGTNAETDGVYTLSVDSGSLIYWYVDSENRIYTTDSSGGTNYYLRLTGKSSGNIELTATVNDASQFTFSVSSGKIQLTDSAQGRNAYINSGGFTNASTGTSNAVYAFTAQAADNPTYAQLTGSQGFVYPFLVGSADIIADIKASTDFKVLVSANADGSDYTEVAMSNSLVTVEKNSDYKYDEAKTNNFIVKYDGVQIGTIPVVVYDDSASTTNYNVDLSVNPGAVVANVGDGTKQLNATVTVEGLDGTGWSVKYSGGSDSVATVSEDGLVTIVGEGSTTITATVIAITYGGTTYDADDFGSITATIPVVVNAEAEEVEVTYSITGLTVLPDTVEAGQGAQATATAVASDNSGNHSYTFTYAINGNGVSINSSTGVITTTSSASGTYTVTATLAQVDGNGSFNAGTVTKTATFTVVEPASYEYTIKGADGNALAGQNITLNEGQTYTPSFSVKLGDQNVTSGYAMTLSSESTAISISGTTITANKVTEDTVATVTATVAPFSRASASGTSVEFTVTVKATAQEPDDGSDASASGNIKDYTGNPPFTPGDFVEVKAPSTSTTSGSSTNYTGAASLAGWKQTVVGSSGGATYELETSGISSGERYVIVYKESADATTGVALKTTSTTSNNSGTTAAVNIDGTILTFGNSADVANSLWTFTGTNTYEVKNGSVYFTGESTFIRTSGATAVQVMNLSATDGSCNIYLNSSRILGYTGSAWSRNGNSKLYLYEVTPATGTASNNEYAKLDGSKVYTINAGDYASVDALLDDIQESYKIYTNTTNSGEGTAIAWEDSYVSGLDSVKLDTAGTYDLTITYKNQVLGTITVAVNTTTPDTTTIVPGVYAKLDGTEGLSYSLHNASGTIISGLKASSSLKVLVADNANGTAATELSMSNSKVLVEKQSNYANTLAGTYYFDVFYDEDGDETADSAEKIGSIPVYVNGEATLAVAPSSTTVAVNGTQTLTPAVTVEGVEIPSGEYTITWSTSNDGIATVTNGVVTGVAGGDATITATLTKVTVTNKTESNKKDENTLDTPISVQVSVTVSGDDHEHSYTASVTKQPTCTEAGVRTYTCECGDSYTEAIDALGHNYVDGECTNCGEADPDYVAPTEPPVTVTASGTLNMTSVTVTKEYGADDPTSVDTALLSGLTMTVSYSDGREDVVVQLADLSISNIKTHDSIGKYIDVDYNDPVTGTKVHTYMTVTIEEEEEPTEPPTTPSEPSTPPSSDLTYVLVDSIEDGKEYVLVAVSGGKVYALKNTSATDDSKVNAVMYEIKDYAADMSTVTFDSADAADLSEWLFTEISDAPTYNASNYLHWLRYDGSILHGSTKATIGVTATANKGQFYVSLENNTNYLGIEGGKWERNTSTDQVIYIYAKSTGPIYSMTVAPATSTLKPGETVDLTASLVLGTDAVTEGVTYEWNHNGSDGAVVGNGASATFTAGRKGENVTVTVVAKDVNGNALATGTATVKVVAVIAGALSKSEISVANGEAVSLSDITLTLTLSDGSTKTIANSNLSFNRDAGSIDTNVETATEVPVTVTYTDSEYGYEYTGTVTVKIAAPVTISDAHLNKATMVVANGGAINAGDISMVLTMTDGTIQTIPASELEIVGLDEIDTTQAGEYTVTVTYTAEDGTEYECTLTVTVQEAITEGFFLDTTGNVDWENGEYIIVWDNGDGTYSALNNKNGATTVTITDGMVDITYANAADIIWTFDDTDGNQIHNGDVYLRSNSAAASGDNEDTVSSVTAVSGTTGGYAINLGSNRYLRLNGSSWTRGSSGVSYTVYLYKWTGSTSSTEATLTGITLSEEKVNVANGGKVDLSKITAVATYSDGSTANLTNAQLSYDASKINTALAGTYTVPVSYTENGKTVSANVTVVVAAASSGGGTGNADYIHNFTEEQKNTDSFYTTIDGDNLRTDKGTVEYNGETLTTAMKMNSGAEIVFKAPAEGSMILVFNKDSAGKAISVNGTEYVIPSNGIITNAAIVSGNNTIKRTDGESFLFYMEYVPTVTDGITVTAPGTLYIAAAGGSLIPTHTMDYVVRHNDADVTDTEGAYTIEWSTLDSTVAIIDENGVLTGLKPGTTSVTANVTMSDETEYSATVLVTVLGPGISTTEEMALIAKVEGRDTGVIASTVYAGGVTTTNYTLGYVSSDENVATVDANGNVTAVGKGTATITTYIKAVNGFEVYTGDGKNPQPAYFDSTVVTVTEKEVSDAHLNSYDYVIKMGSTLQDLVDLLEYKSDVFVEGDGSIIHAEEGVKLTIQYNTGDETIVKYADDNNDGTDNGGGLVIGVGAVDLSTPGTYYVNVTYTEDGKELFRDTIWVHVEEYDPKEFDGTVIREDGIHYILDTDGIDVNEEYVIVAGNAAMAIKNPNANAVGSSVATGAAVSMATGDLITKLNNSGTIFRENVDYLTIGDNDAELSTWLFDTMVDLDNGLVQYNLSNNLRYLGSGNTETQLVHTASKHVYLEAISVEDGEYRIILGYGLDDQPYYLGYVDGIWTSTTEASSVYLYNRVAELSGDYGFNYELREKTNKTEITEPLSIPASFVYEFVEPNIFYNYNTTTALSDGEYRIVWSSSDPSVATVDQNGRITAIKKGTAVITANLYEVYGDEVICNTHNTEHVTRTVTVNVTESNPVPVLTPDELTIGVGSMPNFSKINVEMTFPGTEGDYDYEVPHDQLNFKLADAVMVDANGNTIYEKDEEGNTTDVPVGFDNTVVGIYEVPVSYAGTDFTLTIYVVEDPYAGLDAADAIPGFPDAGSVRMNKTAEGVLDFTETGVTKIELTAAGVSTKNSVDVVLIVDVSNSMGWSMDWFNGMTADKVASATDNLKIPSAGADGTDKLDMAMAAADEFASILLNVEGGDNTVTFVTFAGADRNHGGSSDNVDSVRTPMVAIGDYATASQVFADTKFTTLEADGTSAKYVLQIGGHTETIDGKTYGEAKVSGTNRGNTNYDYAFGEAIDAVDQIKAKYAAENNGASYDESGRQIHVVFMTDGAPSHYNNQRGTGNANDTLWDGSGDTYTTLSGVTKDSWLAYVKNYNELANQLKDKIYGAYTVGFDMAHGGFGEWSWGEDDMQRVLEGLAKNTIVPVTLATDEQELNDFYTSLARALAYAGTNAKVTDKIGGNFSLFTGTSMYSTDITQGGVMSEETLEEMNKMGFPINVYSYRLVVHSDIGDSLEVINEDGTVETVTVDESHLGLRVNEEPEVLETITFNATGTEAYSDLILNEDGTQKNIMTEEDGVRTINASTFTYTATLDTFIHNDVETVHADEEVIEWKIGNITDAEVAMQYYAYLDGSLDNPREATAGVYATNEYAYAEYVDVYGKYVKRYYGVPQIAWGAASVTVRFYLVEKDTGRFVNRAGVTFSNPANRIFLDGRAQYQMELNNSITVNALDALAKAGLAGTNILYDVSASAIITNSTTSGQGGVSWHMDNSLDNEYTKIADLLFDTDTSDGFYSNVILDIPVIMTDMGESLRPLTGETVVIDYGKPMDINVFSEEEQLVVDGYVDFRNPRENDTKYWYTMELVGFANYSSSFDLRDYVRADSFSQTLATANGTYSIVEVNGAQRVRFTPNSIMKGLDQVFVAVAFQEYHAIKQEDGSYIRGDIIADRVYYMYKQVNVIPATVVYYETDGDVGGAFGNSKDGWTLKALEGNTAGESQDSYTVGGIYGNDSSYNGDTMYSNGSSYVAAGTYEKDSEGNIIHPVSTSFTFTGTGFDIIGRTGKDQGTIKVTIVNNATKESQTISAICKGQEELYQVPVLSVNTLKYGTYTVTVTVLQGATYTTDTSNPLYQLNMGNQFYFDAVRIFGTMTGEETIQTGTLNGTEYKTSEFTVESIYAADGEAAVYFEEVRDQLIDADSFGTDGETAGVLYMDDYSGDLDISNYKLYGANDEVYLKKGNVIAFSFDLQQAHTSFDLGMKSADSQGVTAKVTIVANGQRFMGTQEIGTSTAQFYDLLAVAGCTGVTGTIHVVIENTGDGILSLTDLKVAGSTAPVALSASAETLDAAKFATDKGLDVLGADFGTDSVRVARSTTMQVVTEANVESLKITNAYGEEVWFSAVSTEVGGQLIWTVVLRPTLLGDQSFTITGFNADGEYGQSQSAVVSVELY